MARVSPRNSGVGDSASTDEESVEYEYEDSFEYEEDLNAIPYAPFLDFEYDASDRYELPIGLLNQRPKSVMNTWVYRAPTEGEHMNKT